MDSRGPRRVRELTSFGEGPDHAVDLTLTSANERQRHHVRADETNINSGNVNLR